MQIPDKQECLYICEMLESGLIDYCYIHPWAIEVIESLEVAPFWLCELVNKKYRNDQLKAIGSYIYSEPFELVPKDTPKFHMGCLWLRYERREWSWATFLEEAGKFLDAADCDWDCETPYHYLNLYEDAYFTEEAETETKRQYLEDHDMRPWIDLARKKFEPFKSRPMLTRTDPVQP